MVDGACKISSINQSINLHVWSSCFRQQLERLPRRQTEPSKPPPSSHAVSSQPETTGTQATTAKTDSQYLLTKWVFYIDLIKWFATELSILVLSKCLIIFWQGAGDNYGFAFTNRVKEWNWTLNASTFFLVGFLTKSLQIRIVKGMLVF